MLKHNHSNLQYTSLAQGFIQKPIAFDKYYNNTQYVQILTFLTEILICIILILCTVKTKTKCNKMHYRDLCSQMTIPQIPYKLINRSRKTKQKTKMIVIPTLLSLQTVKIVFIFNKKCGTCDHVKWVKVMCPSTTSNHTGKLQG